MTYETKERPVKAPTIEENIAKLAKEFGQQFVRKGSKFFDVEYLNTALAKTDIEMMIINQVSEEYPEIELSNELLRGLIKLLIVDRRVVRERSIQAWNGSSVCLPGNPNRLENRRGAVTVNA